MSNIRKVAVLVGSIRRESINRQLALAIAALAPKNFVFEHLAIDDLPLYNQDNDANMPAQAQRLKKEVLGADALLFVTPEYNRSIPGVLKNALDTGSRPYGANAFGGKPGGVIGTSQGAIGTALAQQHLRNVLSYLDVPVMGQPEAFIQYSEGMIDDAAQITDERKRKFIQTWVDRYVSWVETHLAAKK